MGEADPWSSCPRPGQPDRDQRKSVETWETWPNDRRAETLEDLAETIETREIRPMADAYQGNLTDGQPWLSLNAQTKVSEVNPSLRIR